MKRKESGDLERAEMYYTQAHFGGRLSLRCLDNAKLLSGLLGPTRYLVARACFTSTNSTITACRMELLATC